MSVSLTKPLSRRAHGFGKSEGAPMDGFVRNLGLDPNFQLGLQCALINFWPECGEERHGD